MMSALLDCVQQVLLRRAHETWPDLARPEQGHDHAPIAEWHSRLDVLEARLAERSRKRLDAESAQIEESPHARLDDAT